MLSDNNLRSFKATLYSYFLDFKTSYTIFISILAGLLALQTTGIIFFSSSGSSISNSSSLNISLFAAIWIVPISIIVITSNTELIKKFSFPVDRKILSISHLVYLLLSPLVFLLSGCALYLAEYAVFSTFQATIPNYFYLWLSTKESFISGFCLSYSIILFFGALAYFVFMFFYRYKIATSVSFGILLIANMSSPQIRRIFESLTELLFKHDSIWSQCGVIIAVSILFWALGYFPLMRMEVKK